MNPLPEGFRLVLRAGVKPAKKRSRRLEYWMHGPESAVRLPNQAGMLMAMLMNNYGSPINRDVLFETLWGDRVDGGPLSWTNVINVHLSCTRRLLRSIGIDFDYKSRNNRVLTFSNLRSCEPIGEIPKKHRSNRNWRAAKQARDEAADMSRSEKFLQAQPVEAARIASLSNTVDYKLMKAKQAFKDHQSRPIADLWAKPARVEAWEARGERS